MADASDMDLLRAYNSAGSEEAFAELVQRHIDLVYSVAFRHVGTIAHAEEITQAVFVILARKAPRFRREVVLEGWLHETTRFTALSFLRSERRRQSREQEAYMQSTLYDSDGSATWTQLAPLLDEAVSRLGQKDRDALMLRYFMEKKLSDVADAMNVSEAAAQRRVLRAVEKLRRFFSRRGLVVPAAILTGAISANSVQAAPVALAKSVAAVAITKGTAASSSTLILVKGATKVMAWAQAKTAVAIGTVAILAAGTTTLVVQNHHQNASQIALPASELKFAGYGDPEATIQTYAWAISRGDGKTMFTSLSADCQQDVRDLAAQTGHGLSAEQFIVQKTTAKLTGASSIRIRKEVLMTNQVLVNVSVAGVSGDQWIKVQKFGDEWKLEDFDPKGPRGRTGLDYPSPRYGGIDVAMKFDAANRVTRIAQVLPDSAASHAGLTSGLVVQKINGDSMAGKSVAECVFFTRGRVGTKVVMELFDPELNRTNTVELTRHRLMH